MNSKISTLIWVQTLLTLFPIIIMTLTFLQQDKMPELIYQSEWSLATSVVAAQIIVNFLSGVFSSKDKLNHNFLLYVIVILLVLFAIPLYIFTSIQFSTSIPIWLAYTQVILYFIGILAFMVFGGVGAHLESNS